MIGRLSLLRINLINRFQRDTAYFAENWSNVFSTVLFTATQIVLVEFLFGNITSLGGFSKNDIYFLLFFGQIAFYSQMALSFTPATEFAEDVNQGNLDIMLTKPVPVVWHAYTKSISFVQMFRDGIPPMLPFLFLIDWSALEISTYTLAAGLVIFIAGFIIDHVLVFTLSLSSFWSGSSTFILNFFWAERTETKIPFETLFDWFKVLMFILTPVFVVVSLSVSVILGHTEPVFWSIVSVSVAVVAVCLSRIMWRKALRQYSSASS
ncbi:hypothetical protein BH23PAT2_BH23PAT2_04260 [soil metagenome]